MSDNLRYFSRRGKQLSHFWSYSITKESQYVYRREKYLSKKTSKEGSRTRDIGGPGWSKGRLD